MQNPQSQTVPEPKRLDWTTMVVPFLLIIILCLCFLAAPDASKAVLENLRSFLGENFGVGYLAIGLGIFLLSIYIAFSRYGTIRLGKPDEKPLYSNFAWGSMMFTSGLAADILFYSLCEWVLYANDPHLAEMAVFRTGRAHTRSFTGVRSRGASMSCSPLPLASCFMCAAAINRNTPKPAARSSENTQTGLPEP